MPISQREIQENLSPNMHNSKVTGKGHDDNKSKSLSTGHVLRMHSALHVLRGSVTVILFLIPHMKKLRFGAL